MTTVLNRRVTKHRLTRATVFGVLAFAAALCQAPEARAQWATNGSDINNTNAGNVGVGTAAPQGRLHIGSNGQANPDLVVDYASEWVSKNAAGSLEYFLWPRWTDNVMYLNFAANGFHIRNRASNSVMFMTDAGNVGVGTTSPNQRFGVQGMVGLYPQPWVMPNTRGMFMFHDGGGGSIYAYNYPGGSGDPIGISAGTVSFSTYISGTPHQRMFVANSGNVGIGTGAPNFKLDVNRGNDASDAVLGIDANGSSTHSPMLYFRNTGTAISRIMSSRDLQFQNSNNTPLLYLTNTGSVGIGTTAPATALHVVGDVTVTGNLSAKYQDVAEWVPSTQSLAAGTVVALDTERANHVVASATAYDTRVAGVISAQPGLSLGERGEGKVLVATTGRVKIKADATRAPIRIGDLLVTSDVPGVAMKSEPIAVGGRQIHAPGTIIGKALESLDKGTGEILVLLSLQ